MARARATPPLRRARLHAGLLALLVASAAAAPAAPRAPSGPAAPAKPGAELAAVKLPPCSRDPDDWVPVGGLQAPLDAGRFDEVERVLLDFHASFEAHPACEVRMLRPFLEGFEGTPEALLAGFDRWVAARPDSWTALTIRGVHWMNEGYRRRGTGRGRGVGGAARDGMRAAMDRAAQDLERAVALHPRVVVAHGALFHVYKIFGDTERIWRLWERARKIDPLSVHLHVRVIDALEPWWGGDLDAIAAVVAHARQHVDRNPRLARVFGSREGMEARAISYLSDPPPGSIERQIELYSQALRYGEPACLWHLWRAQAYLDGGYYDSALADAAYALAVDPAHVSFNAVRIRALLGAGRDAEALRAAREAKARSSHHWFPWYEGQALMRIGRAAEAARAFREAAASPDASPYVRVEYLTDLGEVLVGGRRHVAAEAPLREAVQLRDSYARAWLALGESLREQGKHEQAVQAYERYLALSAGDRSAARTRAAVKREIAALR